MALAGMLAWRGPEPSLACARVSPPCSLIALMPSVPSLPLPDSTIPMAYSLWSSASAAKKESIGVRSRPSPTARRRRCPFWISSTASAGAT